MMDRIPADAELVLHIGAPKTGSSAIQRHCCLHAADLRAAGIHYPPHPLDANGVSGGHGELFGLLLGGQAASARRALACHLADARRAGCRLLLSAEGVFAQAAAIVPALPTPRFHIVCLLRHPLDAIASHHNQGIKRHFGTGPLAQAADALISGAHVNPALSGGALFDWLRTCGRDRMTVLPYIVNGQPVDALDRLAAVFGLPAPAGCRPINRSYTPAAAALRRMVNGLPEPLLVDFDERLDRALQAYSDASDTMPPQVADLLDAGQSAALERLFRPDVERLEAAFGIRLEVRGRAADRDQTGGSDTLAAVWRHVQRDARLAEAVRAAVAAARREGLAVEPLDDLARLVDVGA